MRKTLPDRTATVSVGLIFLTLLCACTTTPPGSAGTMTGQVGEPGPQPGDIVCRYEAPSGSNIRQKVCYRVLNKQAVRENRDHALEQIH